MFNGSNNSEIKKIDSAPINGLLGTVDSLGYSVGKITRYMHSIERWYGTDGDGSASTTNNLVPFQLVAGDVGVYGAEVQIMAASDVKAADHIITPIYYNLHRMQVYDVSTTTELYILQFWAGTGTFAESSLVSESPFYADANKSFSKPVIIQMERIPVTYKLWARVKCTSAAATCSFILGLQAYQG